MRVQGSTSNPTLDTALILQAPPLHRSPFTSWFCSAVRLTLLASSHTRSSSIQTILWVHIFHRHQTPSNMLEPHMIWPDTGFITIPRSSSHTCLLALPWTHTLSCPPAFALEAPLPGEHSPRHACGHSFMSFTSLLKYHLLHEAHTDHPSETATFPGPTRLLADTSLTY